MFECSPVIFRLVVHKEVALKRILYWFFLLILLGACTAPAGTAMSDPVLPQLTDQTGWWVDTTGQLSPETEQQLEELSNQIAKAGFQLGGAIFSNSVSDPLDLATQLGNHVQLGSAAKDNGIAIVVLVDKAGGSGVKPAIGVAIGSGLEGSLNDAKVGRFLDQTYVPARKDGDWQNGLVEFVSMTARYLADPSADEFRDQPGDADWVIVLFFLFFILMVVVFLMSILSMGGSSGSSSSTGSGSFGSSRGSSGGRSGGGGGFSGGGASR